MFLRRFTMILCLVMLITACSPAVVVPPTVTASLIQPLKTPTVVVTLVASDALPAPKRLWIDPHLPTSLRDELVVPDGIVRTELEGDANFQWKLLGENRAVAMKTDWIYVAAVAFPTILGDISIRDIRNRWNQSGNLSLLMSEDTKAAFSGVWGQPADGSVDVKAEADLLDAAWKQPGQVAILPFERLSPRWKVLKVDAISPFDRDFDASAYPLKLRAGLVTIDRVPEGFRLPESNYDPEKLTTLVLTGVTALSRRTAKTINQEGADFLLKDIGEWLRSADLTHVSNEVSFNPDCSPQRAESPEARFCSLPLYVEVLEKAGTDIVELTGNHNLDYGADAYRYSLELYRERGWKIYGGGETSEEARQALLIEHHGNRMAFLGCNYAGPQAAWASASGPGAAKCDLDWIESEVVRLTNEGYLAIVTFQSLETEDYKPSPMQRAGDFRRMAKAGAVVVSGSASHWPQAFEFVGDSLLHFGLGNLFFDQMERLQTREAFQDKHVFYAGRYIGVELMTTLLEDAARPRPMTVDERTQFMKTIFEASGWK